MNHKTSILLLLVTITLLSSCIPTALLPNCRKGFDAYSLPITDANSTSSLKTNGLYISDNGKAAFYLYKNGKVKILGPSFSLVDKKFWVGPNKVIRERENMLYANSKEWWGDYVIAYNTITIQWFNRTNQELYKREVFVAQGKVINDSTIDINLDYCPKGNLVFMKGGSCILRFYSLSPKPDSTKAWFNNKKWYKTKLHSSRR
jgi:hypothetical protein